MGRSQAVAEREFLSLQAAAELLGVHEATLRRLVKKPVSKGGIKAKKVGKPWRIRRSDLDAWFDAQPRQRAH